MNKPLSVPFPTRLSELEARAVFDASRLAMVLTDPTLEDNPIVYVNRAFETLTGYTASMAVGRNCRFLQCAETDPAAVARIRAAVDRGEELVVSLLNARADGETFLNALMIAPVRDPSTGEIGHFVGLQTEIARDETADRLRAFEDLVAEIQHRVKNHLSMILALVRLDAEEAGDPSRLSDLARRIESLQLLYEEMTAAQGTTNEDRIQLGSYLGRVANAIAHLDTRPGVRMNVQVDPLEVDTEIGVRIGLVVSEVLTNAMQHAFADRRSGLVELRVTRTEGGGMRAIVADDGVGLPEGVDWPGDAGLGGRIVTGLCDGLDATLNVVRGAVGTVVTFDVPTAGAT